MQKLKNPIEKYFNRITRYHYFCFFFLFISKIPISWHVLNLIFITPPIVYTCGSNATEQCPCDKPIWDTSVFTETMQTKFNIICERTWLISFSQSMIFVGTLVGAFLFGFLSDKYGRLSMFTLCCLILATAGSLVSIMPTAASFIFMRFIEGMGAGGAIVTGYVLCIEYCGVKHREIITGLYHIPINLGHISLAGVSYLLRNCDDFQLALSVPVFFFVLLKWVIFESPKWLMDSGQTEQAVIVMEKIAQFNKESVGDMEEEIEAYNANYAAKTRRKISFWQIFRHKKLSLNFMCMSFIYFACGMGYYGVSQYIGKMSGNIHLNVALSGALLLPGTLASLFLLKILSRREFLMGTLFLSGIFMIAVVCIPSSSTWARVIVACICNCFFFMSFIIVFLYGVELFPTSVRNSVLGVLSMLSRVGQIAAPPINALPDTVSGSIFGIVAIISGVLCYPLPETKNSELPSSLEDSKTLPRRSFVQRNHSIDN